MSFWGYLGFVKGARCIPERMWQRKQISLVRLYVTLAFKMQVQLKNHKLPHGGWQQSGNLFLAGYGHFDEWLLKASDLERVLSECKGADEVVQLLSSMNGCYAFVYKDTEKVIAVVDPCRSIPLYYSANGDVLTDVLKDSDWNTEECEKLAYIEFVQGTRTLLKGWRQLEAGHLLWHSIQRPTEQIKYFSHRRPLTVRADASSLTKEFVQCIANMRERLVASLNGRPAVVPLSGGFDSRFILSLLVSADYPRIKAFTYGRPEGHEAQIAKKVCEQLGVDWQFIEYTDEVYKEALDQDWDQYLRYAGNGSSVPQEQEYFAIRSLAETLDKEAVFLPGFCGDVQAGSFIPDVFFEKRWFKEPSTSGDYIFEKLTRLPKKELLKHAEDSGSIDLDFENFYSEIEEWVLMEREAKYIINGVRCYEHFGFSWMLPLWDSTFIEFWQKVPMELRRDRKLYSDVLTSLFFKPMKIDIKSKHFDARFSSSSWQSWLRYVLPKGVKDQAKKLLIPSSESEINNLNTLRDLLATKLGIPVNDAPVNEMMARYYLNLLKLKGEGE